MAAPPESGPTYSVCQGKSTAEVLTPGEKVAWRVMQFMPQISPGDIAYLWKMGPGGSPHGWGRAVSVANR